MKTWIIVILIIAPSLLMGHSLGVSGSYMNTDHYELENPIGVGVFVRINLPLNLFVDAACNSYQNSREYYGLVVSGFMPPSYPYVKENVTSTSWLYSYEASLCGPVYQTKRVGIALGFGVNANKAGGKRKGKSTGRTSDLYESDKFGTFAIINFQLKNLYNTPFSLYTSLKYKWFSTATSTATDIKVPFYDKFKAVEWQGGVMVDIRFKK